MPAIKAKGSGAGFSPVVLVPASLVLGGGGEVGGLLLEGVSWEAGGGTLVSGAGGLELDVGGMGSDLEPGSTVGLVLVKLMPEGSLENPVPVFLKPPELERFTPGGNLKLEFFGAAF